MRLTRTEAFELASTLRRCEKLYDLKRTAFEVFQNNPKEILNKDKLIELLNIISLIEIAENKLQSLSKQYFLYSKLEALNLPKNDISFVYNFFQRDVDGSIVRIKNRDELLCDMEDLIAKRKKIRPSKLDRSIDDKLIKGEYIDYFTILYQYENYVNPKIREMENENN